MAVSLLRRLASLIILPAIAKVLREILRIVTDYLAGFAQNPCDVKGACNFLRSPSVYPANAIMHDALQFKRSVIDEFFFTIIYTIIIYMLAISAFKLIDQIPAQVLRWMGDGARPFADEMRDSTENLTQYTAVGGFTMTNRLTDSMTKGASQMGAGIARGLTPNTTGAHVAPTKGVGNLGKSSTTPKPPSKTP